MNASRLATLSLEMMPLELVRPARLTIQAGRSLGSLRSMTTVHGDRLSADHRALLEEASAISPAVIATRGYESLFNPRGLPPEFRKQTVPMPGLLIPVWDTQGTIRTYQFRLDDPAPDSKTGRLVRYLNPAGGRICLDVPSACRPYLADAEADLWITEGAKKVDAAVSHGIPSTIGLLGVTMWQREGMALPDWKDIALQGRRVVICFDSDVMVNPKVRRQLDALAAFLDYRGAQVKYCLLPGWDGGASI
jgi:hypothetical protein